ncbi:sugar phosphate isomerase/epimerase family protein [Cyclobacterium jeungdonense]|uniref:Sugar phosphate isomerase/epimerase family protein n=1 Tax=Cyclobacterium jeungdonense TaxID=708087 RepID=A0ABT8CB58_9BACT|nr:sugar phosphate isomerase/epimerase family protein [Cyclobacterium jeungdonense]MDN3688843.1 sugar phosphate isomerase/epimerase family protein [Cyclobacterium jeungdonense]
MKHYHRRQLLKSMACLGVMATLDPVFADTRKRLPALSIGACDWSIGKTSDPEVFGLAREIGLDGVQVSLGTAQNDMHLRQKSVQLAYLEASREHGVAIASLAIGELNRVPYKSAPETEAWVSDSVEVAKALGCTNVLLAFFGEGDLREDPEGQAEVVRRLRKVAPKAEAVGVNLAIESWLSAEEHLKLIEAIGSPNVKVYYDVANATEMGYDIFREMELLGTEQICEIHFKENGNLLGQGKVDFKRVKSTLDKIGYKNWIIMEGALPKGAAILPAYQQNLQFVRQLIKN